MKFSNYGGWVIEVRRIEQILHLFISSSQVLDVKVEEVVLVDE